MPPSPTACSKRSGARRRTRSRCCLHIARVGQGPFGAVGHAATLGIPLDEVIAPGETLFDALAYTWLGDPAAPDAIQTLDELPLGDLTIPVPSIELAVADDGTPEAELSFHETQLQEGRFFEPLPALEPGSYRVWARACLAGSCAGASTPL